MSAQSVGFPLACQACGTPVAAWKGQAIRRDELLWEINFQCENCGLTSCDWGRGEAPAHIRQDLLSRYGPSRIGVDDAKGRVKALQLLRRTFGWSLERARQVAAELGQARYECTDVEAEFLALRLREAGVLAVVGK